MDQSERSIAEVSQLLRSCLPWRKQRGLRLCARLGATPTSLLPLLISFLSSPSSTKRRLALTAIEAGGAEGRELLMVLGQSQSWVGTVARNWLDAHGYDPPSCPKLLFAESAVVRKYAYKRILFGGDDYPESLVEAYIEQAERYHRQVAGRWAGSKDDAEHYAGLLTAISERYPQLQPQLSARLPGAPTERRLAVFAAWARGHRLGRDLLIEHALMEKSARVRETVVAGLRNSNLEQRRRLIAVLRGSNREAKLTIFEIMQTSPWKFVDEILLLIQLLQSEDEQTRIGAAEILLCLSMESKVGNSPHARHAFRHTGLARAGVSREVSRALETALAELCPQAASLADQMVSLLSDAESKVRHAALFVLDLVSLSLDQKKSQELSEFLAFATLAEADESERKEMEGLLQRLRTPPGDTLGFLLAA